jgi:hypothetical protein
MAFLIRCGDALGAEAFPEFNNRFLNPTVITFVWDYHDIELKLGVKRFFVAVTVAIDEITNVGYFETVFSKKPLIHFYLPLISLLV